MSETLPERKGEVRFIGVVESSDTPSKIRIFPEYCKGLHELNGFSHSIILYWLHLRDTENERKTLQVIPRGRVGAPKVGVFASRSPSRPNPIGLCVVKLLKIDGCTLIVEGLDAFKGSPIIDIKPYIPEIDSVVEAKTPKWLTRNGDVDEGA